MSMASSHSVHCGLWRQGVAAALLVATGVADAANWQIQPRITIGATYTDNVSLDRAAIADDSTIFHISPGLSLQHDGTRFSTNLDYNLRGVQYVGGSDRTRVSHQLQFGSASELVREHLFLNLSAGVFQALIDNDLPYSRSSLNFVGNQTDVAHFHLRPSYRYQFGTFATFNASYGFSQSFIDGRRAGEQQGHDASVALASGSSFERVTWSLAYDYRRNSADRVVADREFEMVQARVGVVVTDWLRLHGSGGREINSFSALRPTGSATIWSAGATWSPSRRTTLSASIGERAWGRSYSLDLQHQRQRMNFSLSYSEDYQTYLRTLLETVLIPLVDEFGRPVIDPLRGVEILLPIDVPTLTDDVYISRRWRASVGYRRQRDTLSLNAFRSERELELAGQQDTYFGVTGTWSRRITRMLSANLSASVQRNDLFGRTEPDYLVHVSTGLSYRFGTSLSGSLSFRHYRRLSDIALRDYAENAVTGSLTYLF